MSATVEHTGAMHIESVAIYGLFENGICLYIGQTVNIGSRRFQHTKPFPTASFKVLYWVPLPFANETEEQLIREYRQQGQARFNGTGGGNGHFLGSSCAVIIH